MSPVLVKEPDAKVVELVEGVSLEVEAMAGKTVVVELWVVSLDPNYLIE